MPELVNSRVGSLPGTSGADGTIVCPLPLKNSRKSLRMRAVVYGVVGVIWLRWRTGPGRECAARARRDGNSTCKGYQSTAAGRRNRDQGLARQPGSRPPASSVVGVPAGGSTDRVAVKAPTGQQVGGLAPLCQVHRASRTEAAPDQVTGNVGPVALEVLHCRRGDLAGQTMSPQLGAD